jgi:hypothetical protein
MCGNIKKSSIHPPTLFYKRGATSINRLFNNFALRFLNLEYFYSIHKHNLTMTTEETSKPTTEIKVEEKPNEEEEEPKTKRPVTKEKLRSIMEAASALTALGEEEDGEEGSESSSKKDGEEEGEMDESGKRFIPEHKKPDAALTFPEKVSKSQLQRSQMT